MEMNKKMFDIHTKMKELLNEATILSENGELEKAAKKMDDYADLDKQFELEKKLFDAKKALDAPDEAKKAVPAAVLEGSENKGGDTLDSEKSFAAAFRAGFPVDKAIMVEGTPASAGYLVPQDIQTRINRYSEVSFDFTPYINVEPVTTNTGSRVYATKASDFAFQQVSETGEIPVTAIPQYEQISYSIKDFGGIVPVSRNLANDSDQNITAEIVRWLGKGRRGTINSKVIALIKLNATKDVASIDDIQSLLISDLGGAYNSTSTIFTNDDGIAWLASLQDENKRSYLTYNPTEPAKMQIAIGAKVVPVVNIPNGVLPSASVTNNNTVTTTIPMFIGDLKAGITCFDRQQMTLASSDVATVGTGENQLNAFSQRLILFRACQRMDFKAIDTDAYLNCAITVTSTNP